MRLIITIDTEEDGWDSYTTLSSSVRNIERLPLLQELFDNFGVKPTYLITYPVASDHGSVAILKAIHGAGRCEIGSHCHPWNTPPFEEERSSANTMLCNLKKRLQFRKMSFLHMTIEKNFGISPVSFRCGRWGYNSDVAVNLQKLGYKVDTSIAPFMDWSPYEGPDFSRIGPGAFRFEAEDIFRESPDGPLLEVPATVGFYQRNFSMSGRVLRLLTAKPLNKLRLYGMLYRLSLLNRVWLSPEVSDARGMIRLARKMKKNGYPFLNMAFHSPNLCFGMTPFVKTKDEEKIFLERIREFLAFARDEGIDSIKLSESVNHI